MELIPGYKKSESGVIPEDWDAVPVGDLFEFKNGLNKAKQFFGYGTPIVNYMDVFGHPGLRSQHIAGRVDVTKAERQSYEVRKGDVFFTRTSETVEEIGIAAAMLDPMEDAVFSGFVLRARPKDESLDDLYKAYCFSPRYFRQQVVARATYTTRALTNGRSLSATFVARPPVPEQESIAEALSDVDASIAALSGLIAKKRDLRQGAMQRLLTGQTRLPGFNDPWQEKRLGYIGKCLRGVSYRGDSDLATHDTPHTRRLLRSNNVQNATVVTDEVQFVNAARVASRQILQKDDILICMANGSKALVGKAGIFVVNDGNEYTFGAFMGCFRTNSFEANPAFVFYLFLTAQYREYINNLLAGSSINNLRPSSIESLEFSTPPLPEQTAIAAVLSEMDAELVALEARRDKTRALKQAMMQALLTGRVRLPVRRDAAQQTKEAAHA
jgi:type I restriction enzyme S subunit